MLSEERAFDLKMVFENDHVISLKTYLDDLGDHIDKASVENENQMKTMARLMNIVNSSIPVADKHTESLKSRIKKRRKKDLREVSSALPVSRPKDVVLMGHQKVPKYLKRSSDLTQDKLNANNIIRNNLTVNVTDEQGNLIVPDSGQTQEQEVSIYACYM
jgi:hypothetical protein